MQSEPFEIPDGPAETLKDAQQRYQRARNLDPFCDIPPALLNSADIYDYVRATGMIYPFNRSRLSKPASYEISIGPRYIYWAPQGLNVDRFLDDEEVFVLPPNSIGFVTTNELFQLPNYIAARFNLRITNVHRGLLLGTGPLVDPGFPGRLLIPLHNLTTNEYRFRQGEQFAWVEFTKVSPHRWDPRYEDLKKKYSLLGEFVEFPSEKIDIAYDPRKYLDQAARDGVRSSIPKAIADSEQNAKDAAISASGALTKAQESSAAAEKAQRIVSGIGIGAALLGLIAVIGLWYSSSQLALQVNDSVATLRETYNELKEETERVRASLAQETGALAHNIQGLQGSVGATLPAIQSQLDGLQAEVERLQSQIDDSKNQQ